MYISTLSHISIQAFSCWARGSGVFCFPSSKYRALDLPMFKCYVSCATFIFLCIFLVQMLVTKEWVFLCYLPSKIYQKAVSSYNAVQQGKEKHTMKMIFVPIFVILWFLSPSVDRCWGCHLECWFVCRCWPWPSVSQVTYRSVCWVLQ